MPVIAADAGAPRRWQHQSMTFVWFVVWLIANSVGGHEELVADPVNAWRAALILAIALDLGRAGGLPERGSAAGR